MEKRFYKKKLENILSLRKNLLDLLRSTLVENYLKLFLTMEYLHGALAHRSMFKNL